MKESNYIIKKRLDSIKIPAIIAIVLLIVISVVSYLYFVQNEQINTSKTAKSELPKICPDGCPKGSQCPTVLECTANPPSGEAVSSGAYQGSASSGTSSASDPSASVPNSTTTQNNSDQNDDPDVSASYAMGSTNYRIQSDSINSGGTLSTGNSLNLEDTVGEIATGDSTSNGLTTHAGYQQMNEVFISISASSGSVDLGSIGGITGGLKSGSSILTVATDSASGYTMYAKASTNPALISSDDSFTNYTEAVSNVPDYTWAVASDNAEFGFSPKGADITSRFKDNGLDTCAIGSSQTADKCWYKLLNSDLTVASSTSANNPSGTATTINFQSQSVSHFLNPGSYTATITFTATTN
jgi:hypothetical protein